MLAAKPDPRWGRVITAMVTPFDDASRVDFSAARRLARLLKSSGSDGVVVTGTTGEAPTLSHDEKVRLWEEVLDEIGDEATVIAGAGTNSTGDSVRLAREAERIGAHAVMFVAPYYNKPSQEGLYAHFKEAAECTGLPAMVYNVPSRTGCNLLPRTLASLARDVQNIVAVKEASGNLDQVSDVVQSCLRHRPDFLIYSGDDSLTLPILSVGGCGVISVASHLAGTAIKQMIEAYFAGDVDSAKSLHLRLFPLFKSLFTVSNPMPVKTALRVLGVKVGGFRLPMCEMPAEALSVLKASLQEFAAGGIIDQGLTHAAQVGG